MKSYNDAPDDDILPDSVLAAIDDVSFEDDCKAYDQEWWDIISSGLYDDDFDVY